MGLVAVQRARRDSTTGLAKGRPVYKALPCSPAGQRRLCVVDTQSIHASRRGKAALHHQSQRLSSLAVRASGIVTVGTSSRRGREGKSSVQLAAAKRHAEIHEASIERFPTCGRLSSWALLPPTIGCRPPHALRESHSTQPHPPSLLERLLVFAFRCTSPPP